MLLQKDSQKHHQATKYLKIAWKLYQGERNIVVLKMIWIMLKITAIPMKANANEIRKKKFLDSSFFQECKDLILWMQLAAEKWMPLQWWASYFQNVYVAKAFNVANKDKKFYYDLAGTLTTERYKNQRNTFNHQKYE